MTVVRAWRLATSLHAPLTGEGARLHGGRWNSPGVPLVYASAHLSLAVLETLVHTDPGVLPANLVAYELELPDAAALVLEPAALPSEWTAAVHVSRAIGDAWAPERRSLALVVPSVVVPAERNVLLNPRHPAMAAIRISAPMPFPFDRRLAR